MKVQGIMALAVAILCGGLVVSAYADGAAGSTPPAKRPALTPEQQAAVKVIWEQFETDIKPLIATAVAEVQKLRGLRESKAGAAAIKAQLEVVKASIQAIKARFEQLRSDLKAAVPANVWPILAQRFQERMQQFIENHPQLKEWFANHHPKPAAGQGAAGK